MPKRVGSSPTQNFIMMPPDAARELARNGVEIYGMIPSKYLLAPVEAKISKDGAMPLIKSQWYWEKPADIQDIIEIYHEAFITYTDHGRNDVSDVVKTTTNSLLAVYDFPGAAILMGGMLNKKCSLKYRIKSGEILTTNVGNSKSLIIGENPNKSNVVDFLLSLELRVIGYLESRFRQFDNSGFPLFGPPNGFGIMQIDNPKPTPRQIWSWKDNVSAANALLATKKQEVDQHYKNIYGEHPNVNKLTKGQIRYAYYQYYNGGWYWVLDEKNESFVEDKDKPYGKKAVELEDMIQSGKYPPDWVRPELISNIFP
jgi:hypothetical protein